MPTQATKEARDTADDFSGRAVWGSALDDIETESRLDTLLQRYEGLLRHGIAARCPRSMGLDFDDLLQEARVRVWRVLRSEREIRDLTSYLYRIAATVAIDAVRRAKSRREDQMNLSPEAFEGPEMNAVHAHPRDPRILPETEAQGRQLIEMIEQTLSRFPENRRRAVKLHLQGFTTIEIGQLMKWSESKARNLVYRGLDDLRTQLRNQGVEYEND